MPKKAISTKAVREVVVSFRLTDSQAKALTASFEKQPMVGVRSRNMLARKLAIDFSSGKLHYANKRDLMLGAELDGA